MHRVLGAVVAGVVLMWPVAAPADLPCVARYLPAASVVGAGEGRRFVFHAYDATLYAAHGTYVQGRPFALALDYHMQFAGKAIARESVQQMRRLGVAEEAVLSGWYTQMQAIFPDVRPGMTLTGVRLKNGSTVFCTREREIGRIEDPRFADAFFAIWLHENAESPKLRRQLTGQP